MFGSRIPADDDASACGDHPPRPLASWTRNPIAGSHSVPPVRKLWVAAIAVAVGQLAVAACALGQAPTGETSASPAVTAVIVARDLGFDPVNMRLPGGIPVGITLDNRDPGILHNITIISAQGAIVFRGSTFTGIEQRTYLVAPLPDGEFRFVCDVHPGMAGALLVGSKPKGTNDSS